MRKLHRVAQYTCQGEAKSNQICDPSARNQSYVTILWCLIYHFVEYSLCYKLVKTTSQYYFSMESYGILKTAKTSNLKANNDEKMAVKETEPYFNII